MLMGCAQQGSLLSGPNAPLGVDQQTGIIPAVGENSQTDFSSLDPAQAGDRASLLVTNMTSTGLVSLDNKLQVRPQLATSYTATDGGLTWTFTLKPGLMFNDGSHLTAQDVIYSLNRALQPLTASPTASTFLGAIKDADKLRSGQVQTLIGDSLLAPDERTVIIKLAQPDLSFLSALSNSCAFVVKKQLVERYGSDWTSHMSEGGSSGPWFIEHSIKQATRYIVLKPNSHYYGAKPRLNKAIVTFYINAQTVYRAYEANQVDIAPVPASLMARARGLGGSQLRQTPGLLTYYYALNYLVKPLDNIKVRQALALAINKDVLARTIYDGTMRPTNNIIPSGIPGYAPTLTGPDGVTTTMGNEQRSRQLLDEGLQEEGLTRDVFRNINFEVYSGIPSDANIKDEYNAIRTMWKDVLNIDVRINDVNGAKYYGDIQNTLNNPQGLGIWRLSWNVDYPDPHATLAPQFGRGTPNNAQNYGQNSASDSSQQQETQAMMAQADSIADQQQRYSRYAEIEQRLINDVAWIPLFQNVKSFVVKPCLQGWNISALDQLPPDDWSGVYLSKNGACAHNV
ncbi:ABC transporter substrate-binding protein [Ktedonospora formicarum]|uniref:ABC transporter substrate-binding protein n=2 Tax=Ktedonospora formicarum TaxID=2778364 RepID=A0A8J3HYB8_9CHLR|nr:ABC transporter substrate-binding protein [Ktedonospora formicarum]